jgi:hypothetical protein
MLTIFLSSFQIYKSSSKRKAHILKNHPGAELPMSNRRKVNPTYMNVISRKFVIFLKLQNWCEVKGGTKLLKS